MKRASCLLRCTPALAWSAAARAHSGHEGTSGWFGDPLVETLIGSLVFLVVAAPLFAWSNAHLVIIRAVPVGARRAIGRAIAAIPGMRQGAHSGTAPWLALICFSAAMLLWHLPRAYDHALENDTIHTAEHLCFLITSTAFWRVIGTAGNRRLSLGMSVLMVSLIALESALLAALITFAPRPLYEAYASRPGALPDQVIAGVLMWIPASLIYLGSAVVALRRLLQPPRRIQRA